MASDLDPVREEEELCDSDDGQHASFLHSDFEPRCCGSPRLGVERGDSCTSVGCEPDPDSEAPQWEKNEEVAACRGCQAGFGVLRRRHHCRGCGKVFCAHCSGKRHVLPEEYQYKGAQRVCDDCFFALVAQDVCEHPDAHPGVPDYVVLHEDLKVAARHVICSPESTWTKRSRQKDIQVCVQKSPQSGIPTVRFEATFAASMQQVWAVFTQQQWIPDIAPPRLIDEVGENAHIFYLLCQLTDQCDGCFYVSTMEASLQASAQDTVARTVLASSIEHPLCPTVKHAARVNFRLAVAEFRKINNESTSLSLYLQMETKSLQMGLNKFSTKVCEWLSGMVPLLGLDSE